MKEQEPSATKQPVSKYYWIFLDVCSALIWAYSIVKLFVFDVDVYILQTYIPALLWIAQFRFILLPLILGMLWLSLGPKSLFGIMIYVVFFPFVLTFWKIPRLIYRQKSWTLIFSVINVLYLAYSTGKYYLITLFGLAAASTCALYFPNGTVQFVSLCLIPIFLTLVMIRSLINTITPTAAYRIHQKIVSFAIAQIDNQKPEEEIKGLDPKTCDEDLRKKWLGKLETRVLMNKACFFLAKQLKEYHKTNVGILGYVVKCAILVALEVIFFTIMNLSLHKIDSEAFSFTVDNPRLIHILFYSVNALFSNGVDFMIPHSSTAMLIYMCEAFFFYSLAAILIALLFSHKPSVDNNEIDNAIGFIHSQGIRLDELIVKEYGISTNDAVQELRAAGTSSIQAINFLMQHIEVEVKMDY